MPRSSAAYEAMRGATREKVQDAAVTLFARRGFAATNMRDIAREAGISAGLIYRHYETKDELFGALVTLAADGLGDLVATFRRDESPVALLTAFTREFIDDLAGEDRPAEFFQIMNQTMSMRDAPDEVRLLARRHSEVFAATEALIRRGQRAGEFKHGEPAELATCYFAALNGLVTMKLTLGAGFVVPSPPVLTGILAKEGHDD